MGCIGLVLRFFRLLTDHTGSFLSLLFLSSCGIITYDSLRTRKPVRMLSKNLNPKSETRRLWLSDYHFCLMRTILTGSPDPRHLRMHAAVVEALDACKQACRPGATYGDIFDAHAKALDNAGFGEHKLNACGYSLGTLYHWMDWPMIYAGNPVDVEPNMDTFTPFWSILEDGLPAPRRRRTGDGSQRRR